MTEGSTETHAVVAEREMPYPPGSVWRALTDPELIKDWLMENDFEPSVDHQFNFRHAWGVVDCRVLKLEANKTLTYSWAALGIDTVVAWTLTATSAGSRLRMEQSGFKPDQQQAYVGATAGWQQLLDKLEQGLAREL